MKVGDDIPVHPSHQGRQHVLSKVDEPVAVGDRIECARSRQVDTRVGQIASGLRRFLDKCGDAPGVVANVHFALDKSYLSPASTQVLDQIIKVLIANPTISIDLSGHTDPRAPQAYNQALGMRRAISVRKYLLKAGIEPQRMTIRSEGFSKRQSNETGKQPYALDRRVEFEYQDLRGSELEVIDKLDDLQLER